MTEVKEGKFDCRIDGQPADDFAVGDLTAQWEPRVDGEVVLVELETSTLELRVDGKVVRDAAHLAQEQGKRVRCARYEWEHGDHTLAVNVTTTVYNFESEAQSKDFDQCLPTYILELDGKVVPVSKRAAPPPPGSKKGSGAAAGKMLKK